jgi:TatD DNase family protein
MPLCQHDAGLTLVTDTHCHLERFPQAPEVLERARQAGVRIIAVTSRPSDFRTLFPLYGRRDGVRLALGLHPLEVGQIDIRSELKLFSSYAAHTNYIGEVGLDRSTEGRPSQAAQELALTEMLAVPGVPDKVLTVHSRRASRQTLDLLEAANATRVIVHWFSGPARDIDRALAAGFYFSFNPAMIRSRKGQALADAVPRDRILLESDGPYVRVGSRRAEPRDVLDVAEFLRTKWEEPLDATLAQLAENLRRVCNGLPRLASSEH